MPHGSRAIWRLRNDSDTTLMIVLKKADQMADSRP